MQISKAEKQCTAIKQVWKEKNTMHWVQMGLKSCNLAMPEGESERETQCNGETQIWKRNAMCSTVKSNANPRILRRNAVLHCKFQAKKKSNWKSETKMRNCLCLHYSSTLDLVCNLIGSSCFHGYSLRFIPNLMAAMLCVLNLSNIPAQQKPHKQTAPLVLIRSSCKIPRNLT